jgi:hypothetical protein
MPPVKFKDSRKPTWEELQDHLYGVKTIGEAFDRILATKEFVVPRSIPIAIRR